MRIQLHGFYAESANSDILLERQVMLGGDHPTSGKHDDVVRALAELGAAQEALNNAQGMHSRYLIVLESDESSG